MKIENNKGELRFGNQWPITTEFTGLANPNPAMFRAVLQMPLNVVGVINSAYEEISNFHKDVQEVNNMPLSVRDLTKYYIPKLFPAQYQDLFRAAGINPLDVVISIDAATYLKGDYNMYHLQQFSTGMDLLWKDFVAANPSAAKEDILVFINSMIQVEGLTIYLAE